MDCDVYGTSLRRNHNALAQFSAAYDDYIDEYTAAAPGADTNGDGIVDLDEYLAQTTPALGPTSRPSSDRRCNLMSRPNVSASRPS